MRSRFSQSILATVTLLGLAISLNSHAQDSQDDSVNTQPAATEVSPEALYEKASKAVVRIISKNENDQEIGSGSGFILDESHIPPLYLKSRKEQWDYIARRQQIQFAFVVTNYHVIEPAVDAQLEMPDGEGGRVWRVVIEDPHADLAMLEVSFPETSKFESLSLAKSSPAIGSTVFAIGNPLGLKATLTNGLVSGFRTDRLYGTKELQTNAAISPGSSGGPLLDTKGAVLGVTSSTHVDGQNINFAVPSSEIKHLIMELNTRLANSKGRSLSEGTSLKNAADDAIRELDWFGRKLNFGDIEPKTDVLMKAVTEYRKDNFKEAIRLLRKAKPFVDREHRHLWYYAIGKSHFDLAVADGKLDPEGPILKAAFKALNDSLAMNPDFAPTHAELLRYYFFKNNVPRQLTESDALVRLMPRCDYAYQSRGEAYWRLKDNQSAIADLMTAIRLDPRNSESYRILGELHREEDKFREAITLFKKALAEDSVTGGGLMIHVSLGDVYRELQDYDLAITHYRKVLRQTTQTTPEFFVSQIKNKIEDCVRRSRK